MKNIDINKHITDLLFLHDFVTIPNFGSFVTSYKPAIINNDGIYPPSKYISFNSVLKNDDGLLISYLSETLNIDYKQSKLKVSEYVRDIFLDLDNNKQVVFENIGSFEFDKKLNLIFEPDFKLNFLADAYGFSAVHLPTLDLPVTKLEKTLQDKSRLKKSLTSSAAKVLYIILPILVLLSVLSVKTNIFDKSNYNYSDVSDIIFSDSNENKSFIERQLDSMTKKENALMYVEEIKPKGSEKDFNIDEKNTKPKTNNKNIETIKLKEDIEKEAQEQGLIAKDKKEIETKTENINTQRNEKYILVAGSFSSINNAKRFVKKLVRKGVTAEIIKHKGKFRVSAASFKTKKEAKAEAKKLKKREIKTWVSTR